MRCQFTHRPRTNCRFGLACDGEGPGASPGRESSRLTGDGQGQLSTPYSPPMLPPWRQERGGGWLSEFSPVQARRAPGDGEGDEPPLAAVGLTVSPGHQGVSGAFLSMYTCHASLSMPGVLCPSSQVRTPHPEKVVGLSVAPGSTRQNPASATQMLVFCPHRFMGILAPDPGRLGPMSPTRPL